MKEELFRLTALALRRKLDKKEVSISEIVESLLGRIEYRDRSIRSMVLVDKERARKEAKRLEEKNDRGKLYGIPIVVKDNICVKSGQGKILYKK